MYKFGTGIQEVCMVSVVIVIDYLYHIVTKHRLPLPHIVTKHRLSLPHMAGSATIVCNQETQ